jgi:hypothetical protein
MTDHSIDSIYNQPKEATMQEPTTLGTMQHTIQPQITQPANPFDLNGMFLNFLTHAVMQANAPLLARIAELETKLNNLQDTNANFIKEIAEEVADAKMAEHTDEYDHYEMECQIERIDDKIDEKVNEALDDLDISDKINDALNGAHISINI